MTFVHRPYIPHETIAAIATPPGMGGIAIIRISGKEALDVADKIFSGDVKNYATHTAHYGKVIDSSGNKIDEALVLVMLGKRSFTGEDTVEIQCHGGHIAARKVLQAAVHSGARIARPGEFTFKAFMNGKLDLAQAESVQSLIGAKNETAFMQASKTLEGKLSEKIVTFQQQVTKIAAIFEAWVDFPEEGLEFATHEEMIADLNHVILEMEHLLTTYHEGRRVSLGIQLAIIGEPNVGKSSLLNALVHQERAIVTPIAGTTRDLIEEEATLGGIHFRLIDTAGIRDTLDPIEQEGIRRSRSAMQQADLVLFVLDAGSGTSTISGELPIEKTIAVINKIDLKKGPFPKLPFDHVVEVSAKEKWGLEALLNCIQEVVWKGFVPGKEEIVLSNARHKQALERAKMGCVEALVSLEKGISPEFLLFHLRGALVELGTILGQDVTEEILNSIFSQFCIGK